MAQPLRIGLVGLDTSHVTAFTKLLNDAADPHHVPGGRVVAAFPGGSRDFELSWSRVDGFTAELRDKHGVQILDTPEAVADAVDLVFIESVDGRVHLDQFRRVAPYRKPTFIDKPLAVSSADAREIFRHAGESGVPVMSASSLRYDEALAKALSPPARNVEDPIVGCDAHGPMALQPTQPGLFWYGIHTVEVIYAVMGTGCREVSAATTLDHDLITGVWADGRIATFRGMRKGHSRFGVTLHRDGEVEHVPLYAGGRPPYAGLLEAVMRSLPTGQPDVSETETLEIIRFIEAANESRETGRRVATL